MIIENEIIHRKKRMNTCATDSLKHNSEQKKPDKIVYPK